MIDSNAFLYVFALRGVSHTGRCNPQRTCGMVLFFRPISISSR